MQKESGQEKEKVIGLIAILLLCAFIVIVDFIPLRVFKEEFRDNLLKEIIQRGFGAIAGLLLAVRLKISLFKGIENPLYLLPCILVAVNNFPFIDYFKGEMAFLRTDGLDILLFAINCLLTGLWEEVVFRGLLFSVLVERFSKDKKGLWLAYLIGTAIFALAHFFNGFSLAVLGQVGYTLLTGGLFAFCFIKTKNILCPALIHGIYNFCGLLLDSQGLGAGVVFGVATVWLTVIIGVIVGVWVLYGLWKYDDEERERLYRRLGISSLKEGEEETKEV